MSSEWSQQRGGQPEDPLCPGDMSGGVLRFLRFLLSSSAGTQVLWSETPLETWSVVSLPQMLKGLWSCCPGAAKSGEEVRTRQPLGLLVRGKDEGKNPEDNYPGTSGLDEWVRL